MSYSMRVCLLLCGLCLPAFVFAQAKYPVKQIRMVFGYSAGGCSDIMGRLIAQQMSEAVGQQVVVENRPGAAQNVAAELVAKSAPDGYTLLMVFPSHTVNPSLYPDIPFDTAKAFAPITMVSAVAPALIVSSQSPMRSMKDLVSLAKAKPGVLNHASVGSGSMGSLGAELLKSLAGIKFTQVVYKSSPAALTALMSGEIDFYLIGSVGTAAAQIKAGRVRALAVGAKERVPALPDVPPIAETVPGYEARGWNAILAPAGTPKPIIDRLNAEIGKIVTRPDVKKAWNEQGAEPMVMTAAEFEKYLNADIAKWANVVKVAGVKAD